MQRQGRKMLSGLPTNTKAYFLPMWRWSFDNEFIYVGLSCPSAWRNKIKFGHWQAAHHGRTPEDNVCELCLTAFARYTQEGQEDIWSPVVCVYVIPCWVKLNSSKSAAVCVCHTPCSPTSTSWEGPLRDDSLLQHLIIKHKLTLRWLSLVPGGDEGVDHTEIERVKGQGL